MLGWPPTGKKKVTCQALPPRDLSSKQWTWADWPLGMCRCSRISLAKNPMDIPSEFSNTAWFEHLIWSQKKNKSLERSGLTSTSPNCFLPHPPTFSFSIFEAGGRLARVIRCSEFWKFSFGKWISLKKQCINAASSLNTQEPLFLGWTARNDSISLKRNC